MSLRQQIIQFHESNIQLKRKVDSYQQLKGISDQYPEIDSIEALLNTLDSSIKELSETISMLDENATFKSPRIFIRLMIQDEKISIDELAEHLGTTRGELDNAIDDNHAGNPLLYEVFKYFNLPLKPFMKFLKE